MTKPAIPTVGEVLGPAIDAMVADRPAIEPHLAFGRWGHVIAGWRAQFELARRRMAQEFMASRRTTARGQALTEVCASEYEVERDPPRRSLGEVTLTRSVVHFTKAALTVTVADATDEASATALFTAIGDAMNAHRLSVYDATLGFGSHVAADSTAWTTVASSVYSTFCADINIARARMNAHVANVEVHKDADQSNTLPALESAIWDLEAGGSDVFADGTVASQASVLRALNRLKVAVNAHLTLEARAGVVRRGHRFAVQSDPAAVPPVESAQFVVQRDTFVATGAQTVAPRLEATQTGPSANQPRWLGVATKTILSIDTLFDAAATLRFSPTSLLAAGGHGGQADDALSRAAGAAWAGRHGPTRGALLAGALLDHGASRAVVRTDVDTGTAVVHAVDETWSQSIEWMADIARDLSDPDEGWLGFGCRLDMGTVRNVLIRLDVSITLRDATYLVDTSRIAERVRRAARSYFDDRPDWYVWRKDALRAAIVKADRRILACPLVNVLGATTDIALPELAFESARAGQELLHMYLADNAVLMTFSAPS